MKKTFCDNCGKEMTEATSGKSFAIQTGVVNVALTADIQGADVSTTDLCKHCVIDAIKATDDRVTA